MDEKWGRLPSESTPAYRAFFAYLTLPSKDRTVLKAYRAQKNLAEGEGPPNAPSAWRQWAANNSWLARAQAYDDRQAERDLLLWEERRTAARERDWQQAETLRAIVDGALPSATQFFRRQVGQPQGGTPTVVNEAGVIIRAGTPAQVVVTVAFDVVGMTTVLEKASKLQRLILDEPTDNIGGLHGIALNRAIERALLELAVDGVPSGDETGVSEGDFAEEWSDEEDSLDEGATD